MGCKKNKVIIFMDKEGTVINDTSNPNNNTNPPEEMKIQHDTDWTTISCKKY